MLLKLINLGTSHYCGISLSMLEATSHWALFSHAPAESPSASTKQQAQSNLPLGHSLARAYVSGQSNLLCCCCGCCCCGCSGGCWLRPRLLHKRRERRLLRPLLQLLLLLESLQLDSNKNGVLALKLGRLIARAYANI